MSPIQRGIWVAESARSRQGTADQSDSRGVTRFGSKETLVNTTLKVAFIALALAVLLGT